MPNPPRFPDPLLSPIMANDIVMERIRSAIKFEIPRGLYDLTITQDEVAKTRYSGALYELSAYVLGRRRKPIMHTMVMTMTEHTSWWQHTKEVHFPTISKWIRRPPRKRMVQKTETMEVKVWETFPEADIGLLPKGFGPVVFQAYDSGLRVEG